MVRQFRKHIVKGGIVMAKFVVASEQYYGITGQLLEIQRQLRLKGGSPINPEYLKYTLQDIIEPGYGNKKGAGLYEFPRTFSAGVLKEIFAPFLTETFTQWYNKETAEKMEQKLSLIKPEDIDWEALKNDIDIDKAKFGEYSLNPETQGLNFESFPLGKIKVLEFKEFGGKPRAELAKHLAENYADKYHIPGIEYWRYIIENPDKAPASLKDGNYHYFFGSTLRSRDGHANVPLTAWDGGRFARNAFWLDYDWYSDDRVVLLEK